MIIINYTHPDASSFLNSRNYIAKDSSARLTSLQTQHLHTHQHQHVFIYVIDRCYPHIGSQSTRQCES